VLAFLAAKSKGLPVFFRGELHGNLRRSCAAKFFHRHVLSRFFQRVDMLLSIGAANREYYRAMGVPERKIVEVPYAVDNERIIRAAAISESERKAIRLRFGLPVDQPVILFAAKFMRRKRPDDLLRAAVLLERCGLHFSRLDGGQRRMETELRSLARDLKRSTVAFPGSSIKPNCRRSLPQPMCSCCLPNMQFHWRPRVLTFQLDYKF